MDVVEDDGAQDDDNYIDAEDDDVIKDYNDANTQDDTGKRLLSFYNRLISFGWSVVHLSHAEYQDKAFLIVSSNKGANQQLGDHQASWLQQTSFREIFFTKLHNDI